MQLNLQTLNAIKRDIYKKNIVRNLSSSVNENSTKPKSEYHKTIGSNIEDIGHINITNVKPVEVKNSKCDHLSFDSSKNDNPQRTKTETYKEFKHVPGPRAMPIIGTLYKYFPFLGEFKFKTLHKNAWINYKRYGPLVREEIVPDVHLLHVFNPEDIESVFRNEGKFPERRSHLALEKYRKDKLHVYNAGGILPMNGPEWGRIRSIFQKSLSSPNSVKAYVTITDDVVMEFANRVKHVLSTKVQRDVADFLPDLNRLNLELVCIIAFDVRLDSFSPHEMVANSRTSKVIKAAFQANSVIVNLDNGLQLWRYFDTPLYRKFCKSQLCLEETAIDLIAQKMSFFDDNVHTDSRVRREPSLLESYLANPAVDIRDLIGMSVDFLMGGIDTTSYTTSFALYHLAKNPDVQKKLYQESLELLPNKRDRITSEVLSKAYYLKACLKESLRLNPVSIGVGRVLVKDTILSGYLVPKGTIIVTQNMVASRLEKYFSQALRFFPERWLKSEPNYNLYSPFLSLPFGFGPRSCIARRLAEQNMHITLLRLIRNFEVGWAGHDMDIETVLINKPDGPVKVSFNYRKD